MTILQAGQKMQAAKSDCKIGEIVDEILEVYGERPDSSLSFAAIADRLEPTKPELASVLYFAEERWFALADGRRS